LRPPQVPLLPITDPNKTAITAFKDVDKNKKSKRVSRSKKARDSDVMRHTYASFKSENSNLVFPS